MKKSIFYLFFFGLLMFYFNANAQDVAIGVRGGISIPNLTAGGSEQNPLNTGYSSRQGPDFGLYGEFKFSNLFSLQPMIEYSSQGGKKDGLQALPTPAGIAEGYQQQGYPVPTYVYARYNSEAKFNYLMIPILAKFGWDFSKKSPFRFYVDAGPFVGFLLNAKQVTTGSSYFYSDAAGTMPITPSPENLNNTQDIKSELHSTNFGFEGNVGFAYHLKNSYVFIEGGGNYGFLNIQKGTANGKNNIGAGTASLGYAYWF